MEYAGQATGVHPPEKKLGPDVVAVIVPDAPATQLHPDPRCVPMLSGGHGTAVQVLVKKGHEFFTRTWPA